MAAGARNRWGGGGGGVRRAACSARSRAALIAATALLALLMPLVITALAPGFAGRETLQLAIDNARLMLPYLAFAGPVTVMMALLNAQGPLCADGVLAAAVQHRADRGHGRAAGRGGTDAAHAAQIVAATVGVAGLLQLSMLVLRRGESIATPLADFVRQGNPRLSRQGRTRHDGVERAAAADGRRRDHRVVVAVGGVVALFRQPAGRTAARHRRRRHGHGADPGIVARGARRGSRRRSRMRNRAASNSRSGWRCRRRSG